MPRKPSAPNASRAPSAARRPAPRPAAGSAAAPSERFPAFSLPGSDGRSWSERDLRGATTVVYCYPKDNTSGCTSQACDFRDQHAVLTKRGVRVLGVSPDALKSHAAFIAKQSLPFVLLADVDQTLLGALGVWVEKSMYGRRYLGVLRSTFLIGPDLLIRRAWRKVAVPGHVAEVIAALDG